MLHSRLLKYLDEVARVGSIRKAAARLNVASSAVNRQLRALEHELGAPIFERMRRRVRVTAAGAGPAAFRATSLWGRYPAARSPPAWAAMYDHPRSLCRERLHNTAVRAPSAAGHRNDLFCQFYQFLHLRIRRKDAIREPRRCEPLQDILSRV